jgi:hypothetical protein
MATSRYRSLTRIITAPTADRQPTPRALPGAVQCPANVWACCVAVWSLSFQIYQECHVVATVDTDAGSGLTPVSALSHMSYLTARHPLWCNSARLGQVRAEQFGTT